jgi:hypothetical protein
MGGRIVSAANVKVTFWNNGEIHQAAETKITTFTYP